MLTYYLEIILCWHTTWREFYVDILPGENFMLTYYLERILCWHTTWREFYVDILLGENFMLMLTYYMERILCGTYREKNHQNWLNNKHCISINRKHHFFCDEIRYKNMIFWVNIPKSFVPIELLVSENKIEMQGRSQADTIPHMTLWVRGVKMQ
jgi:hypothetical protein